MQALQAVQELIDSLQLSCTVQASFPGSILNGVQHATILLSIKAWPLHTVWSIRAIVTHPAGATCVRASPAPGTTGAQAEGGRDLLWDIDARQQGVQQVADQAEVGGRQQQLQHQGKPALQPDEPAPPRLHQEVLSQHCCDHAALGGCWPAAAADLLCD